MPVLEYHLPEEKIAKKPKEKRSDSQLLVYKSGSISDCQFSQLPSQLPEGSSLVFNETRVVNARIFLYKPTGARIEVFCLEPASGEVSAQLTKKKSVEWNCLLGGAKKWKEGKISAQAVLNEKEVILSAEKIYFKKGVFTLKLSWTPEELTFSELLELFGKIPLPPYLNRLAEKEDYNRYQTVFAKNEGSVAAPTASLHFTKDILTQLKNNGTKNAKVNLHVGAGTFKPLADSVDEHLMHKELFEVSRTELKNLSQLENLIAVGTTAVRTLESLFILAQSLKTSEAVDLRLPQKINQWSWKNQHTLFGSHLEAFNFLYEKCAEQNVDKIFGYTQLMIIPGFTFKCIKGIITNFHMPKSSLLLLVAALIGDDWKKVYDHALNAQYRFLSYGDSSLLIPL